MDRCENHPPVKLTTNVTIEFFYDPSEATATFNLYQVKENTTARPYVCSPSFTCQLDAIQEVS